MLLAFERKTVSMEDVAYAIGCSETVTIGFFCGLWEPTEVQALGLGAVFGLSSLAVQLQHRRGQALLPWWPLRP